VSFAFRALGTTAVVAVTDPTVRDDAVALVAAELAALDAACSRFRVDSELTRVARAGGRPVRVSSLLSDAIAAALDAARATDGLVDPTVGRTLRLAGYDATFRVVAARDGGHFRARFDRPPGWHVVELDRAAGTVRVPDGVELDLGATAKAFASDRCAQIAAELCGCGVLVGLGGDISIGGEVPAVGWSIGIADHHEATPDITVAIHGGGIATSSTLVRRWQSGETMLHHVIDPRTGRPADTCWRTVTVAARSCLDANVASTAAVVLGAAAIPWLAERRLDARLVGIDGAVATVGGWPAETAAAA
jgi:thiamine biosynthesis lipoprotein ApbE